ncbi:OmpA family protein [Fluviicola sp.]|uniref:OmpA family protein n=1 Tax=Fluviicola sp. TaxID=1917219 RepID=UPI0031E3AF12
MKILVHSLLLLLSISVQAQSGAKPDSAAFYFQFNHSDLSIQDRLNTKAKTKLTQFTSRKLILRAYTDSTGSTEYNLKLAQQRLESVKAFLAQHYPNRFTIQTETAIGEDNSLLSDAAKRRVDILEVPETAATGKIMYKNRTFELGVPIQLEIIFLMAQDVVLPGSYDDIRFLIETLKNDPSLSVILAGHVCCGTDSGDLSGKRANRIKQLLIMEGGISGNRITAIGFGNRKPLFVEDSEEHRQANRRVEATFIRK